MTIDPYTEHCYTCREFKIVMGERGECTINGTVKPLDSHCYTWRPKSSDTRFFVGRSKPSGVVPSKLSGYFKANERAEGIRRARQRQQKRARDRAMDAALMKLTTKEK